MTTPGTTSEIKSSKIPIKLKKSSDPASAKLISKEVSGLYYCPNFLTPDESKILIDDLKKNDKWVGVSSNKNSRRVIHYGYIYSYTGGPLTPTDPIPDLYKSLIERFQALIKNIFGDPVPLFDQLIINEYLPGQGISAHTDHTTKFGSIIVCITLISGVEMEFTKQGHPPTNLYVEPDSLYIMSGDARYLWKHAIAQRKNDLVKGINVPRGTRISLTFRTAQTF
jgi:alkylated DNA repair dioxygenase AlkB